MSRIRDYRPIEYRQVCAIARVALLRQPAMTDAEWKEATKDACQKQGWDNPSGDMLSRALGAVERSLLETMGPRPGHVAPAAEPPRKDPGWTPADYRAFAETVKRVLARSAEVTTGVVAKMPTPAVETLNVSEAAALDQFYAEAHTGNRIAALRRFVEIAIVRPADWDYAAIRAESTRANGLGECFACRTECRTLITHHIIQIQHGGSNYVRNRALICEACHADVHPWLPKAPREARTKGWTSLRELVPAAVAIFETRQNRHRNREAS